MLWTLASFIDRKQLLTAISSVVISIIRRRGIVNSGVVRKARRKRTSADYCHLNNPPRLFLVVCRYVGLVGEPSPETRMDHHRTPRAVVLHQG